MLISLVSCIWPRSQYKVPLCCSTPQLRCATVGMAKPTKAAEFRDLSNEAIEKEIYDCQRALLDQRIAQGSRKVDNFGRGRLLVRFRARKRLYAHMMDSKK